MRIAVDLLAGGATGLAGGPEDVELVRVGPGGDVLSSGVVPTTEAEVRASRSCSARVAARLVRDGHVDGCVVAGPLGMVAATFSLPAQRGCSRPVLAAFLPSGTLLLDVSGVPGVDLAVAELLGGVVGGRTGLLGVDVSGADAATGAVPVAVTDGPTGAVLLSALTPATSVPGLVLGLEGVVGLVLGPVTSDVVAACVGRVADAVRAGVVDAAAAQLGALVQGRRALAGLAT